MISWVFFQKGFYISFTFDTSEMTSACEVLSQQPDRFLDYVLGNVKLRRQIVDDESFAEVLRRVLNSDPSLKNIVTEIDGAGERLEICGKDIFNDPNIQSILQNNIKNRRTRIRKRVKAQYPSYTRTELTKEINRRLKISVSGTKHKVKRTKQITIQQSLHPINVKYRTSGGKVVKYSRTKPRKLTKPERLLIKSNIKLPPSEVVKKYYESGLPFRSEESIKNYYRRMKKKIV